MWKLLNRANYRWTEEKLKLSNRSMKRVSRLKIILFILPSNKPFLNFILFQTLLFCFQENLWITWSTKKVNLQNFMPIFSVILWFYDLACYSQTSLNPLSDNPTKWSNTLKVCLTILWGWCLRVRVAFVLFFLVIMKFRKLKSLYRENKRFDLHKT